MLVFTGAGISTESGIPDFRGPDGLWTRVDPDDFTIERYVTSPDIRRRAWRMHLEGALWGARVEVRPNPGHQALVDLWRAGRVTGVVTQNVDGLHQAAGLDDDAVAELHGNVRRVRCLGRCSTTWPTEEVLQRVEAGEEDPHCPACGALVKTTTVLFGELLSPETLARARGMADAAGAVLVVGSTLSVHPAAGVAVSVVQRGAPMVIVNRGPTDLDRLAAVRIDAPAGSALPTLAEALTTPPASTSR